MNQTQAGRSTQTGGEPQKKVLTLGEIDERLIDSAIKENLTEIQIHSY